MQTMYCQQEQDQERCKKQLFGDDVRCVCRPGLAAGVGRRVVTGEARHAVLRQVAPVLGGGDNIIRSIDMYLISYISTVTHLQPTYSTVTHSSFLCLYSNSFLIPLPLQ